ncbi:MAG: GDSL-type esterase/lipase family protein, partial [bacterium]
LQTGPNGVTVEASNSEGTDTQMFTIDVAASGNTVRIMPLGDSITRGVFGSPTGVGYRRPLWMLLASGGCDVDFVGQFQDGTPADFDRDHYGIDGERDDEVAANVYGYLQSHPADIILLHIGTNALDTNPGDVENILDEIDRFEADSSVTITVLLARIINRNPYSSTTTQFNDNVEAMALDRINNPTNDAYPDNIIIVDMEDGAGINYATDLADVVHPNDTGYEKMADLWYAHLDTLICGTNVSGVTVTSTSGSDLETDDLTCTYSLQGQATTAVEAWYVDGAPLMALCMPFEGGESNAVLDWSGNGHDAVTHGDPVWLPNGGHDGHGAWEFDGSGDDLSAGEHFPVGQSYTKTAWIYKTGSGANGGNNIISGDENPQGHALWVPDNYEAKSSRLMGGHNGNWDIVYDDEPLTLNTWFFVALSYDQGTHWMRLYKNGVKIDSAVVAAAEEMVSDPTVSIGSFGAQNGFMFQGTIDDARIYNRALSDEQISLLYANGSNVITWTETAAGEQWHAVVTPFSEFD